MEIKVGLVIFAGKEILLEDRGGVFAIPECSLPSYRNSHYMVHELINKITFITGSWASIELGLRQSAIFDDIDRNPNCRELIITYTLHIPSIVKIKEGYIWTKLEDMNNKSFYLDHENIIRYCAIGDRRFA